MEKNKINNKSLSVNKMDNQNSTDDGLSADIKLTDQQKLDMKNSQTNFNMLGDSIYDLVILQTEVCTSDRENTTEDTWYAENNSQCS